MMKKTFYKMVFLIYPVVDFAMLAFAIMFSYKLYWIMGIGKHAFREHCFINPITLGFLQSTALPKISWNL